MIDDKWVLPISDQRWCCATTGRLKNHKGKANKLQEQASVQVLRWKLLRSPKPSSINSTQEARLASRQLMTHSKAGICQHKYFMEVLSARLAHQVIKFFQCLLWRCASTSGCASCIKMLFNFGAATHGYKPKLECKPENFNKKWMLLAAGMEDIINKSTWNPMLQRRCLNPNNIHHIATEQTMVLNVPTTLHVGLCIA